MPSRHLVSKIQEAIEALPHVAITCTEDEIEDLPVRVPLAILEGIPYFDGKFHFEENAKTTSQKFSLPFMFMAADEFFTKYVYGISVFVDGDDADLFDLCEVLVIGEYLGTKPVISEEEFLKKVQATDTADLIDVVKKFPKFPYRHHVLEEIGRDLHWGMNDTKNKDLRRNTAALNRLVCKELCDDDLDVIDETRIETGKDAICPARPHIFVPTTRIPEHTWDILNFGDHHIQKIFVESDEIRVRLIGMSPETVKAYCQIITGHVTSDTYISKNVETLDDFPKIVDLITIDDTIISQQLWKLTFFRCLDTTKYQKVLTTYPDLPEKYREPILNQITHDIQHNGDLTFTKKITHELSSDNTAYIMTELAKCKKQ